MKNFKLASILISAIIITAAFNVLCQSGSPIVTPAENVFYAKEMEDSLTLEQCINLALKKNHMRAVSKYSIQIAEAQLEQALSAYWPQINITSVITHAGHNPNFILPSFSMKVPPISMGGITVDLPPIDVAEQNVKLMDKNNIMTSLQFQYPLYTGGLVSSLVEQAANGVEIAKQDARRTDLQIVHDVKRYYWACVFTEELYKIGEDAATKLEATLSLTENLYKTGSGTVKKTDYLKNKIIVESLKAFLTSLENNKKLAKAALINTIGLDRSVRVRLADKEVPFIPYKLDIENLISKAYAFNPDWGKLKSALKVFEARIDEAKSGYYPKIAVTGSLTSIINKYNYGITTSDNKNSLLFGIGMELPIFSGFRTLNKVKEESMRLEQLKEQQILLKEGIAVLINQQFLQLSATQKQAEYSRAAMLSAKENRELNIRAYEQGLVEVSDLIESQLLEAFMNALYQKALFDHYEAQNNLDYIIGAEVNKLFLNKN